MRTLIIAIVSVAVATYAVAAETHPDLKKLSKAAKEILRLEKTGGMITRPGKGKAVVVNCQGKFQASAISDAIEPFRDLLKVEMEVRDGAWKFGDALPLGANVAVYVVDDPGLPMSLVAPESRWGVMNVAQIDKEANFRKEVMRTAILTFGAGVSQYKISPMQPVASPADLDQIMGCALTVDVTMSMKANLEKFGLTQTRLTTYKKACEEGWAPAPTNEYQKAIWDEVHAVPATPMKIEFDPKKGR